MNRLNTLCFSRLRPENFAFALEDGVSEYNGLRADVAAAVMVAWGQGYRVFMCGMAKGFDLVCGEMVAGLLASPGFGQGLLVAVRPFGRHGYSGYWGQCYRRVLGAAGRAVILAPAYHPRAYYHRNLYMVKNSSRLICHHQGRPGGTSQTVNLACRECI